jgi:hypothetical protein
VIAGDGRRPRARRERPRGGASRQAGSRVEHDHAVTVPTTRSVTASSFLPRALARLAPFAAVFMAFLLAGCGGGNDVGSAPPTPTPPPPSTANTGPINVPAGTWSFVRVAGSRCANGSETGIAVRPIAGSRELLLFMDGGGSCATGSGCWGPNPGATNLNGYDEAKFATENKLRTYLYLGNDARNPFAGMNRVMLPYCTGDAHTGTAVQNLAVNGGTRATHFVGAINVDRMLDRLLATWPQLDRVWVLGTSAGGGGATYNYSRIRSRLGTQVHVIVDSAPGFDDADDLAGWSVWGVQPVCPTCTTVETTRAHNRTLDATSRYAFLSFRYDETTANRRSLAEFDRDLSALVSRIQAEPNSRTFIADNSATGFGPPKLHVITTQANPPSLQQAHADFIGAMVSGTGWTSQRFVMP